MRYLPEFTEDQIRRNNELLVERRDLYRARGLDLLGNRAHILKKAGPLRGRTVDVGSGRGTMALSLAKAGHRFISIDKDELMLEATALTLAHEDLLSNVELYVMNVYALEFADNSFSNIFMVDVLHHIKDLERMFRELNRVLSSSGRLVMADLNKKGMEIVGLVHAVEGREHARSALGKNEALNWFERNGYKVAEEEDECHWILIADKKKSRPEVRL